MFRKATLLALFAFGLGGALLPSAAAAQGAYGYGRSGSSYYGDRNSDRRWRNRDERRDHEWREHERRDRRAEEWRERQWRANEWRERERWENRSYRGYYPGDSFYFGYGR
jgi:hypothetical protein